MRVRASLLAGLLAVTTVACGGDDGGAVVAPSEESAAESGNTLRISSDDVTFSTESLRAEPGEITIVFDNDSKLPHNIEVQGPDGDHATDIETGPVTQELTFTVDEPGTYTYVCVVHPATMEGELIVG